MVEAFLKKALGTKSIQGYVVLSTNDGQKYDVAFRWGGRMPNDYHGHKVAVGEDIVFSYEDEKGLHESQLLPFDIHDEYFAIYDGITVFSDLNDATYMAQMAQYTNHGEQYEVYACKIPEFVLGKTFRGSFYVPQAIEWHDLFDGNVSICVSYITPRITILGKVWSAQKSFLPQYILPKFKEPLMVNECVVGFVLVQKRNDENYDAISNAKLPINMGTFGARYEATDKGVELVKHKIGTAHMTSVYRPTEAMPIIFPSVCDAVFAMKKEVGAQCKIYTVCMQTGDIAYRAGEKKESVYYGYGSGFVSLGLSKHQYFNKETYNTDGNIRTLLEWGQTNKDFERMTLQKSKA